VARRIAFVGALSLVLISALGFTSSAAIATMPVRSGLRASITALPQDRLHFGLASQPTDLAWMTASGVPWRYRYQYLSGGVNTGNGWETWNSPSGAFATFYMNASSGSNYIPIFTYYELLQSTPSTGANESDRDFSNLNNTATMSSYYANFKLLMQKAGAFAKPVVVHVEPDLWGYLQQRAAGGDASTAAASVTSSGFSDVSGLPNSVQGFGWALLKLRDLYAPNVVMALHASGWASGIDIDSSTNPGVNAVAVADSTAAFLNSAGISSNPFASRWDLVFNDLDDHDAGWWEKQGADNAYFTHWWDPTNTVFPNFNRYLAWVGELKVKTGLLQVAWQVPVGNQYFLTMNNACGHYQDNVASYFVSHANTLYASGLIAVLFGAGNACQTTYTDAQSDGVANNGGTPTTDLLGYCNACNTHTSVWPDDDGGYLRTLVGQYYASWQTLGGAVTSGPDASSWGSNRLDVFVRGTDNALYHKAWAGAWYGYDSLGGGLTSDPGVVSWGPNRIDVFVRGTDNALYHKVWAGAWYGWESLGGGLTSGPDVASWSSGRLDIFVRGTDNGLWHKVWDGQRWSAWESLGGVLASDPTAVSWGPNRVDVFARATDNTLIHKWWDGVRWNGWETLGGSLTSAPDAASCGAGRLDVYATGAGSALFHLGFSGAWGTWQNLGGAWASEPGAVCPGGTGLVELFARGTDGAVWHSTAVGS
jgi:hypothetical protein